MLSELKEVRSVEEANELLTSGWTLIQVAISNDSNILYVMGKYKAIKIGFSPTV